MNETQQTDAREPELNAIPEAVVEKRRGFSLVWLIPLVAAVIGGLLAYQTLSEKGPTITQQRPVPCRGDRRDA
jgi:paraquat-inducible protein B